MQSGKPFVPFELPRHQAAADLLGGRAAVDLHGILRWLVIIFDIG